MKQETKPLYKVLNFVRTKGEWKTKPNELSPNQIIIETDKNLIGNISLVDVNTDQEAEANAQYTALAVNNLHILAEAIENLLGCFDNPVMRLKGFNDFQKEAIQTAKEALNRIS